MRRDISIFQLPELPLQLSEDGAKHTLMLLPPPSTKEGGSKNICRSVLKGPPIGYLHSKHSEMPPNSLPATVLALYLNNYHNSYNQNADKLAKEARNLNNDNFVNITSLDANTVANLKLKEKSIPVKHQICNINGDRLITKTIPSLRTGHYRGMKFDRDGRRSCRNYDSCLDTKLTPAPIFDCPAILAALQERNRQQISMWTILNRLPEQSSGSMVLSDLVPSWIRHSHHHNFYKFFYHPYQSSFLCDDLFLA
ncbi:RNase H domain-containing protein [Trichonephila clavipes]|uniref:RNase H domain-containing protein n=1 Tax=Trichonephila clavipes TaxID=2585209 RepID=A0A8X6RTW7_TRICX|nr:RNase H domain-containing protein [Trichonephila clavipes]